MVVAETATGRGRAALSTSSGSRCQPWSIRSRLAPEATAHPRRRSQQVAARFRAGGRRSRGRLPRRRARFGERLFIERSLRQPDRGRGVVADVRAAAATCACGSPRQAPSDIKNGLAMFGLPEFEVRSDRARRGRRLRHKIMMFFPEEVLVSAGRRAAGPPCQVDRGPPRALHWPPTRERGQVHEVDVAVDAEGRILAVRDRSPRRTAPTRPTAWSCRSSPPPSCPGRTGVPNYGSSSRWSTPTAVPVEPLPRRRAPHACFVMERLIDRIARELGSSRAEVRRRNFIQPDEFPYDVGLHISGRRPD